MPRAPAYSCLEEYPTSFLCPSLVSVLPRPACGRVCECYAASESSQRRVARPWSWAIGSSQARGPEVVHSGCKPSRILSFRVQHGLQAFGRRRITLDRNDAVARALFDGLMNHVWRLFTRRKQLDQTQHSDWPSA